MPIFQNDRDLAKALDEDEHEPQPGPSQTPEKRVRVNYRDPEDPGDGGTTSVAVIVGDDGEGSDGYLFETVQQVRSDLPICIKCPRKSVPFLRVFYDVCSLCFLPYVSKVLRDSVHRCPACGIRLGSKFASASEAFVVCVSHPEHLEESIRPTDDVEFL
ncbi:hypothetical protein QAD02_019818 [Eretmocerus hayati]|uniref:Uncharacterized protein n=1 Tax=Eretmocerus hayati TaxID=131215 RepID=A0ACC2PMH9_9HYME|nr:hypothetical protein QAD02_019818 [Eretmocerus hayati]